MKNSILGFVKMTNIQLRRGNKSRTRVGCLGWWDAPGVALSLCLWRLLSNGAGPLESGGRCIGGRTDKINHPWRERGAPLLALTLKWIWQMRIKHGIMHVICTDWKNLNLLTSTETGRAIFLLLSAYFKTDIKQMHATVKAAMVWTHVLCEN